MTTRHYGASEPPRQEDRDLLNRLRHLHQLPAAGTSPSSDRFIADIERIVTTGEGLRYEVNKLTEWLTRLPLARNMEKIDPDWPYWNPGRLRNIADRVLIDGWSPARAAIVAGTTRQTVEEIVAVERAAIKRGTHAPWRTEG